MMTRKLSVSVGAVGAVGFGAIAVFAGALTCSTPFYDQSPDPGGSAGHISRNNSGGSSFANRRIADDFTLATESPLAVIRFWGGNETDAPLPNENVVAFNFRISDAAGPNGGPGATLWEVARTIAFDTTFQPTGANVGTLNAPEFAYRVEIIPPLILPPGNYFLSIGAYHFDNIIDADTETWQWSVAPGAGNGVIAEDRFDQQGMLVRTDITGTDMAFTLEELTPAAVCPGDIDGDFDVDLVDLQSLLFAFGTANLTADMNGDGFVDLVDLQIVLFNFGSICSPCL